MLMMNGMKAPIVMFFKPTNSTKCERIQVNKWQSVEFITRQNNISRGNRFFALFDVEKMNDAEEIIEMKRNKNKNVNWR